VLLLYITDRKQFVGGEARQQQQLLAKIAETASAGVDFIQLREKDLDDRSLEQLGRQAVSVVRQESSRTRLLINSRTDIALVVGADGVHLRSDDPPASEARVIWATAVAAGVDAPPKTTIGTSCHSAAEVQIALAHGADFAVLGPVFEKDGIPASGIEMLKSACIQRRAPGALEAGDYVAMPVLALGGVTAENAFLCLQAGAAGLGGIRLFQRGDIAGLVHHLRAAAVPLEQKGTAGAEQAAEQPARRSQVPRREARG